MSATVIQSGKMVGAEEKVDNFILLAEQVRKGAEGLRTLGPDGIIDLLDKYGRTVQDLKIRDIEGVQFLSLWLRRGNLEKVLKTSFSDEKILAEFVGEGRKRMRAQPRGLVCHWMAGNVPTLGLFSLFQSMLVMNSNILRIPAESVETMTRLLKIMSESDASPLMDSFSVVAFPSSDAILNSSLSSVADARVVWGGKEAVEAITGLPKQVHCEDVVLGPKFSFAIMDKKALESPDIKLILRRLVGDIQVFEQSACSSPQVLFFEKGIDPGRLMSLLAEEFGSMASRNPKTEIDNSTASQIILNRAKYALSPDNDVKCSNGADWTLLYDTKVRFEEPVQSRTLFVKPIDSVMDVLDLVTNKVQTVGCEIHDREKLLRFADAATLRGVARCVPFGQMNFYDTPWDGMLVLTRLVRFCSLTE